MFSRHYSFFKHKIFFSQYLTYTTTDRFNFFVLFICYSVNILLDILQIVFCFVPIVLTKTPRFSCFYALGIVLCAKCFPKKISEKHFHEAERKKHNLQISEVLLFLYLVIKSTYPTDNCHQDLRN